MNAISGIRPSGKLHLGNYIGSILPAIKYDANVLIAQYHAPGGDWVSLHKELQKFFPLKKILLQEDKFDGRLYFQLLSLTSAGLLTHMPQYKEKTKTALMFTYPVLMAHDIAGYDLVIVGDDQRPHIEFANDILPRVGATCPEAIYEGGRVMDLRHPENKMSKSEPDSCLFLSDSIEVIEQKVKKAVTNDKGRANLEFIFTSLGGTSIPEMNSDLKTEIVELLRKHL